MARVAEVQLLQLASRCWCARRVCQALVHGLGPGDQLPAFRVLQFVSHFALFLLPGDDGARGFVLPGCLPERFFGVSLHAGEHGLDVPFVVTELGEGRSEPVVYASDDLPEIFRHLFEETEDVGVAVPFDGLVEGEMVPESLVDRDRVPYGEREHGVFGISYQYQSRYPPPCGTDHLRRNVKTVGDAHPLTLCPVESHPGTRVGRPREPLHDQLRVPGDDARPVLARQPVKAVEGGRVLARVNLKPLLEPEHGGMFVHVGPKALLDSSHSSVLPPSLRPQSYTFSMSAPQLVGFLAEVLTSAG